MRGACAKPITAQDARDAIAADWGKASVHSPLPRVLVQQANLGRAFEAELQ